MTHTHTGPRIHLVQCGILTLPQTIGLAVTPYGQLVAPVVAAVRRRTLPERMR
ncbi:MAG: hypothetical protein JSS75_04165 [Bacteroidetes bacterium]|nr:hypothetical protein [Bacteroidota bacterium]